MQKSQWGLLCVRKQKYVKGILCAQWAIPENTVEAFCAINVTLTTSSCGGEDNGEEEDRICILWHLHFVINTRLVCSAAAWCFLKFDKPRCKMLGVGWKRSTVRVCDSPSYLWKMDGLHVTTKHIPMPPVIHWTACTSHPSWGSKFFKSSSWSMSTKGTNNSFYAILNRFFFFSLKWVGSFFSKID